MGKLKDKILSGFKSPIALPDSSSETEAWQKANYSWWQNNPMRYDWKEKISVDEFSKEFFEEIDKRFFLNSKEYLPWRSKPFDRLIDFQSLKNKDVLEIGVGAGSHAGLLAKSAKSFVGIDITDYAVESTEKRFKAFGLNSVARKMDGESLEFPDNSFDFIWSWGVIHHSSRTPKIIDEIYRVLRPGGETVIMVYHRGWWNYYIVGFIQWILSGDFFKKKSLHESVQLATDGALARYYNATDWKKMASRFTIQKTVVLGPKTDIILLPGSRLKNFILKISPNFLCRFFTNTLKMGSFFVISLKKPR